MKNNITNIIVGCIAILAAVFAVIVVVGGHRAGDGNASVGVGSSGQGAGDIAGGGATPDDVSVEPAPDGDSDDEIVTDQTAGYSFSMPTNWYLEPNAGAGVTVYPDYDPTSGDQAACKIEISSLAADPGAVANEAGLSTWVTAQLHADPTADIAETARTDITIGTSTAIEWQGELNGVSTTLVYVPTVDGKNILEFAPSTLAADDSADGGDDCTIELQALLANLNI